MDIDLWELVVPLLSAVDSREATEGCNLLESRLDRLGSRGAAGRPAADIKWHPGDRSDVHEKLSKAYRQKFGESRSSIADGSAILVLDEKTAVTFARVLANDCHPCSSLGNRITWDVSLALVGTAMNALGDYNAVLSAEGIELPLDLLLISMPGLVKRVLFLTTPEARSLLASCALKTWEAELALCTTKDDRQARVLLSRYSVFIGALSKLEFSEILEQAVYWCVGQMLQFAGVFPKVVGPHRPSEDYHMEKVVGREIPILDNVPIDVELVAARWKRWSRYASAGSYRVKGPWPFQLNDLSLALSHKDFPPETAREMHDTAVLHMSAHELPRFHHWAAPHYFDYMGLIAIMAFSSWSAAKKPPHLQNISAQDWWSCCSMATRLAVPTYDPLLWRRTKEAAPKAQGWAGDLSDLASHDFPAKSPEADSLRDRVVRPSVWTSGRLKFLLKKDLASAGNWQSKGSQLEEFDDDINYGNWVEEQADNPSAEDECSDDATSGEPLDKELTLRPTCEVPGVGDCYFLPFFAEKLGIATTTLRNWVDRGLIEEPHTFCPPSERKSYKVFPIDWVDKHLPDLSLLAISMTVLTKGLSARTGLSARQIKRLRERLWKEHSEATLLEKRKLLRLECERLGKAKGTFPA